MSVIVRNKNKKKLKNLKWRTQILKWLRVRPNKANEAKKEPVKPKYIKIKDRVVQLKENVLVETLAPTSTNVACTSTKKFLYINIYMHRH